MHTEEINPLVVSQYASSFNGFISGTFTVLLLAVMLYAVLIIAGEVIRQTWNFIDENGRGDDGDFGSPFILAVARLRGLNEVRKYNDSSWWDYKNIERGRSEETFEVAIFGFFWVLFLAWSAWFVYNFTTMAVVMGSLFATAYVARMARRTMKLLKAHINNKSIHKEGE